MNVKKKKVQENLPSFYIYNWICFVARVTVHFVHAMMSRGKLHRKLCVQSSPKIISLWVLNGLCHRNYDNLVSPSHSLGIGNEQLWSSVIISEHKSHNVLILQPFSGFQIPPSLHLAFQVLNSVVSLASNNANCCGFGKWKGTVLPSSISTGSAPKKSGGKKEGQSPWEFSENCAFVNQILLIASPHLSKTGSILRISALVLFYLLRFCCYFIVFKPWGCVILK